MIGVADVERMLMEKGSFLGGEAEGWLEENEISQEAMLWVCEQLSEVFKIGAMGEITSGENIAVSLEASLQAAIGVAFTIGWELRGQYGKSATTLEVGRD